MSATLKRSLKLWQIVMMGLAYMTPMVVFDTFGIVSGITGGHVPTAYIVALVGMLFTAASYGKLVKVFPDCRFCLHLYAKGDKPAFRIPGRMVFVVRLSVFAYGKCIVDQNLSHSIISRSSYMDMGSIVRRQLSPFSISGVSMYLLTLMPFLF